MSNTESMAVRQSDARSWKFWEVATPYSIRPLRNNRVSVYALGIFPYLPDLEQIALPLQRTLILASPYVRAIELGPMGSDHMRIEGAGQIHIFPDKISYQGRKLALLVAVPDVNQRQIALTGLVHLAASLETRGG